MSNKLNNQIVGARAPLYLVEKLTDDNELVHEFLMSPLTDSDLAELDLWLQTRYVLEGKGTRDEADSLSAFDGLGSELMSTPNGAARILWQSIRKSHPEVKYTTLQYLMGIELNQERFSEQLKYLNEVDFSQFANKKDDNGKVTRIDKGTVYCILAELYGYTFDVIAAMTPLQQLVALTKGSATKKEVTFSSLEEYHQWKQQQSKQ